MAAFDFLLAVIITSNYIVLATGKHRHAVPTFFGRVDQQGNMIDRLSEEYKEVGEGPFINRISREDAATITLTVTPGVVKSGEKVSIKWSGVTNPTSNDFIAYYCPFTDEGHHYLDYFYLRTAPSWKTGSGQRNFTVYNMRESCNFKLYRFVEGARQLGAESDFLEFADGGSQAPLQGHIAMTNDPTQMRIMWVSGQLNKPPRVLYGETPDFNEDEYAHVSHTYNKESMCQAPANDAGFWDPGMTYNVLLTNLKPDTLYYYSYGTEGSMSATASFRTPLPKGDQTPFKFIVYGDMDVAGGNRSSATAKHSLDEVENNNGRFVFHIGDISYARGWAYIWEHWGHLIEPLATRAPYMVGIGNHEYDHNAGGKGRDPSGVTTDGGWKPSWFNGVQDSGGECGVPMHHRYHMPDNGNSVFWYSYDYGMVHMIMMSTEHDYSPGSVQWNWLENDLKNVDRFDTPWVIVGGHRPMYSSQKYYSDYVVSNHMKTLFEDLLYDYEVDMAIWGHYHSYERTCKVYKEKCVDDGIIHIVVGTAGHSLEEAGYYPKEWSVYRHYDWGYGRVTVANSSSLLFEYVKNGNKEVKDSVWLHK